MEHSNEKFIKVVCQGQGQMECLISYSKESTELLKPGIRAIGVITSSSEAENIDLYLMAGGINFLNEILYPSQNHEIMIEILWTLSNIAAGTD